MQISNRAFPASSPQFCSRRVVAVCRHQKAGFRKRPLPVHFLGFCWTGRIVLDFGTIGLKLEHLRGRAKHEQRGGFPMKILIRGHEPSFSARWKMHILDRITSWIVLKTASSASIFFLPPAIITSKQANFATSPRRFPGKPSSVRRRRNLFERSTRRRSVGTAASSSLQDIKDRNRRSKNPRVNAGYAVP